jgi:hypothetical protein
MPIIPMSCLALLDLAESYKRCSPPFIFSQSERPAASRFSGEYPLT